MIRKRERHNRSGFTLVELLIGIAVIGVLVGMLGYALVPALTRGKEFAIQQEMGQLESSLEQFKTKYGFYPPSFVQITTADHLLAYLNRIAPNHNEDEYISGSTRRIDIWWTNVGQYINYDQGEDLVFWLSGLLNNQQYPVTGGATVPASLPAAYDNSTVERVAFYDFNKGQLRTESAGSLSDYVAHYVQPQGKEASFLYIDSSSYGVNTMFDGYTNTDGNYEHPESFQLVTYGMDGLPGNPGPWAGAGPEGEDNICNFSGGRLDRMISGAVDSTARN